MDLPTLLALAGLAFAAAWTPGPNNAMLAASGANYGVRRTVPHILGITFGFPLMIFAIAIGLGEVFQRFPLLRDLLRWGGAAMLLWVAWRIATAGRGGDAASARPFTFFQAAAFQWVNPKGWAFALAITAQFITGTRPIAEALISAGAFVLAGITATFAWTALGAAIGRLLSTDARLRAFNLVMAALVAGSVALLF